MAEATTATHISNQALYKIGEKGTLTDITSDSGELADLCELFYYDTRNEVQKIMPWTCLKTQTTLSTTAAGAVSAYSWYHTLAATVLGVLTINDDDTKPFERRGAVLYCNEETGYFVHTAVEADVSLWDPLLVEAIVQRLASKISKRRTGSTQDAIALYQEYLSTLLSAAKTHIIEGAGEEYEDMIAIMMGQFPPGMLEQRPRTTA